MIRDTFIKKIRNQLNKSNFLNHFSKVIRSNIFPFSTKPERMVEIERNINIDKIMKHKIFVSHILILLDTKTHRTNREGNNRNA